MATQSYSETEQEKIYATFSCLKEALEWLKVDIEEVIGKPLPHAQEIEFYLQEVDKSLEGRI